MIVWHPSKKLSAIQRSRKIRTVTRRNINLLIQTQKGQTQWKLTSEGIKTATVSMLHMFKKVEANMRMLRREMEDILKDPDRISRN